MTPTQQNAMKMALEALEWHASKYCEESMPDVTINAMQAIRAALAEQPARCTKCNYQHGHQIGCENNPLDIALKALAENADDKLHSVENKMTSNNFKYGSFNQAQHDILCFSRMHKYENTPLYLIEHATDTYTIETCYHETMTSNTVVIVINGQIFKKARP